jgi:hypothetical protein
MPSEAEANVAVAAVWRAEDAVRYTAVSRLVVPQLVPTMVGNPPRNTR